MDVKTLTLSDDLTKEGLRVLTYRETVESVIKGLVEEQAKNNWRVKKFWAMVQVEAERQGITKEPDEVYTLDPILEQIVIVKITQG